MGKTESNTMRLHSLDGLRGVAAFVVLLSHIMLTAPVFARATYSDETAAPPGSAEWWVTYTPLHILWSGHEAVYVFFVLSGLVLTLPAVSRDFYPWREYYPKRVVRLYAPVVAAVAFGIALVLLAPRDNAEGMGDWLQARPAQATVWGTVKDIVLVAGPSRLISPLWSLQWEILFSLLLPAYVLFATIKRRFTGLKIVAILAAIAVGAVTEQQALIHLPMFAAGALIAVHLKTIRERASNVAQINWWSLLFVAVILSTARWTLPELIPGSQTEDLATIPAFIGCAMLVLIAGFWDVAKHLLESRVCQWLGAISFSLYLTHEPIVIALAFTLGPDSSWLVALISIPLALLVGWAFYKFVESPSHRLAQVVGKTFRKPGRREQTVITSRQG